MTDTPYRFSKSEALFKRAKQVIPNGISGHFNPAVQVPAGTYPFYVEKAKGAHFWDVDGNKYIDYMCAYGPMILGYENQLIDGAFQRQAAKADTCSLASPIMVELAEYLVDLVPFASWASFAKNGADATNMAVLIARAATGRRKIIAIDGGYHGVAPWMLSPERGGISPRDGAEVIRIPWNDIPALRQALADNSGQVAAFISSPYHHPVYQDNQMPAEGYWSTVQSVLKAAGVVSICDDVRAGFRVDMKGSNHYFGYEPDLTCYCKAIANGYPISALMGNDELKDAAESIFQTGSFWFSAAPMAAALACLKEMKAIDAPGLIRATGERLIAGLKDVSDSHDYRLQATGMPSMPFLRIVHESGAGFHQALCGEVTRHGVFMASHHNLFVSASHTDDDLKTTWDVFDKAFSTLKAKYGGD
ncbi:MAG: aminotransferase class III-fold pyridoxal phosphate-dependent enzyme [Pseudohongiellaceae bacterium]